MSEDTKTTADAELAGLFSVIAPMTTVEIMTWLTEARRVADRISSLSGRRMPPYSSWWQQMVVDNEGSWAFQIGTHRLGVWNLGTCVVMNCLTCGKTFDGGTSKSHPPNWDFTAEGVAHMQGVAKLHAKASSGASPSVPEKEIDSAIGQAHAAEIARLNARIAELSASRDHWMLCHKEAVGHGRAIEARLAAAQRAARERDAGHLKELDAEWERGNKAAHTSYSVLVSERDSLRHLADSLARRLDKQNQIIQQLQDQREHTADPTRL